MATKARRKIRLPDALKKDGFSVSERELGKTRDLALLTLRVGLESYCTTYGTMMTRLSMFDSQLGLTQADIDANHSLQYIEAAFETVLHLQHFAEIVVKQVLVTEHPLLAVAESGEQHVLLHKLLRRQDVPETDYEKLRWVEFSAALGRAQTLINEGRMSKRKYGFLLKAAPALRALNECRNRLLHRGRYVLHYDALDELVAGHILPFVFKATQLPEYKEVTYWRPPPLTCGVSPLERIVSAASKGNYDMRRIAFMKALALGAYRNPIRGADSWFADENDRIKKQAEGFAGESDPGVRDVRDCPVCGVKSLVMYENNDSDEDSTGKTVWWWNIFRVKCMCCAFEVDNHLDDPHKYGVPIPKFWIGEVFD